MAFERCCVWVCVWVGVGLLSVTGCGTEGAEQSSVSAHFRATLLLDEHPVEMTPVHRPVPGRWPVVALGGTQYLAVWEDHRANRPMLYGGRITLDGTALDEHGIPILDAKQEYRPAVASDGADFLVITQVQGKILGSPVSAAGEVLDPEGIVIAAPNVSAGQPSVAFGGEQYLVAWAAGTWPPGPDDGIHVARVKPDGTVLDPDAVLAHPVSSPPGPVGVSFDGSNYLLSWIYFDDDVQAHVIEAARITPEATLVDETPLRIVTLLDEHVDLGPVAGFDGSNHVIAWLEHEVGEEDERVVVAGRVTPEGALLDPGGLEVLPLPNHDETDVHRLSLASGSARSIVVCSLDYSGEGGPWAPPLEAAQISDEGSVSVYPKGTFGRGLEATIATHPDGALMLRRQGEDPWANYPAVVGMRLDAAGMPLDGEVAPASPASRQQVRAAATDGHDFFVLWADTRATEGEGEALFGARVAGNGTPLDLEPIQITTQRADLADVVFDGANYLVTWVHDTGGEGDGVPLRAVRVSPDGELLDAEQVYEDFEGPLRMASASDGTHTLLLGELHPFSLAAVLVDHDRAVTKTTPILHGNEVGAVHELGVTFDGTGYLVVWRVGGEVVGQRISKTGELTGDRFSIASSESLGHIEVSAGGGLDLVVWNDATGIWATKVSLDGEVLDPAVLVGGNPWIHEHDVAFDDTKFIVVWHERAAAEDWSSGDLYAAELSTQGELLSVLPISTEPEGEGLPVLAGAGGRVLVAYDRFVPGPPFDTYRARARVITTLPAIELDVQAPVPSDMGSPGDLLGHPAPGGAGADRDRPLTLGSQEGAR